MTRKPAAWELEYRGSENEGRDRARKIVAIHEGRIVGYLGSHFDTEPSIGSGRRARQLDLAWVDPSLQRRGIGTTMLNLERSRTGYMPIGDQALSPAGRRLQRSAGVPKNPKGEIVSDAITRSFSWATADSVQQVQAGMLQAEQFHPDVVLSAAPVRPTRRRGPQPEQQELFAGGKYLVPPKRVEEMRTGTPRDARGRIQSKKRAQ